MTTQDIKHRLAGRPALAFGSAMLLLVGAAGGAGAVKLTRPTVEMAPTVPTPISHLADVRGIVTVKGQVEAVFGDRALVRDATGRTLVDVGPRGGASLQSGAPITAQGRFDNGQLHARYLVAADGTIDEVAPPPPPHPHGPGGPLPGGPGGPGGPRGDAPPPPPPGAVPPPPPDAAPPPPPVAPVAADGSQPAAPPPVANTTAQTRG